MEIETLQSSRGRRIKAQTQPLEHLQCTFAIAAALVELEQRN